MRTTSSAASTSTKFPPHAFGDARKAARAWADTEHATDHARRVERVCRLMKDLTYTDKEIESQKQRIQRVADDPEKDEADKKKQEEVLGEYLAAKPDELARLETAWEKLVQTLAEAEEDDTLKETAEVEAAKTAVAAAEKVLIAEGQIEAPAADDDEDEEFNEEY